MGRPNAGTASMRTVVVWEVLSFGAATGMGCSVVLLTLLLLHVGILVVGVTAAIVDSFGELALALVLGSSGLDPLVPVAESAVGKMSACNGSKNTTGESGARMQRSD